MAEREFYTMWCPVTCDKWWTSSNPEIALELVKNHVALSHPEYDPYWADEEKTIL